MYDEAAISAEFRELAALADKEYREFELAPGVRDDGDAILARSCVFGYLYDRHFLQSPELLLNELRWLQRSGRPSAPQHAGSVPGFESVRDELLAGLVERFHESGAFGPGKP